MGLATLGAVTEEMSARLTISRLRTRGNRLCARAFQSCQLFPSDWTVLEAPGVEKSLKFPELALAVSVENH